jgi:hypothetical protein
LTYADDFVSVVLEVAEVPAVLVVPEAPMAELIADFTTSICTHKYC